VRRCGTGEAAGAQEHDCDAQLGGTAGGRAADSGGHAPMARIACGGTRLLHPRFELFHTGEWFASLESFKHPPAGDQGGARTRLTQRLSLEATVIWNDDSTPAETASARTWSTC
jgi:hypothetical protein